MGDAFYHARPELRHHVHREREARSWSGMWIRMRSEMDSRLYSVGYAVDRHVFEHRRGEHHWVICFLHWLHVISDQWDSTLDWACAVAAGLLARHGLYLLLSRLQRWRRRWNLVIYTHRAACLMLVASWALLPQDSVRVLTLCILVHETYAVPLGCQLCLSIVVHIQGARLIRRSAHPVTEYERQVLDDLLRNKPTLTSAQAPAPSLERLVVDSRHAMEFTQDCPALQELCNQWQRVAHRWEELRCALDVEEQLIKIPEFAGIPSLAIQWIAEYSLELTHQEYLMSMRAVLHYRAWCNGQRSDAKAPPGECEKHLRRATGCRNRIAGVVHLEPIQNGLQRVVSESWIVSREGRAVWHDWATHRTFPGDNLGRAWAHIWAGEYAEALSAWPIHNQEFSKSHRDTWALIRAFNGYFRSAVTALAQVGLESRDSGSTRMCLALAGEIQRRGLDQVEWSADTGWIREFLKERFPGAPWWWEEEPLVPLTSARKTIL
jgi:hypothetical protein